MKNVLIFKKKRTANKMLTALELTNKFKMKLLGVTSINKDIKKSNYPQIL